MAPVSRAVRRAILPILSRPEAIVMDSWRHLVLALLLSVVVFVALPLSSVKAQSREQLFREAAEAEDRGDLSRALQLYEELVRQEPNSVSVRGNYGAALAKAGRYRDAIVQYREALNHDPENALVRLNLALAEYKQADLVNARAELNRLHNEQPENRQVLYLLADCYLRLGQNRDAITLLGPYYDRDSDDRAIDYAYGTALIRDGNTNKGEVVLDRILRDGNTPEARLLLGEAQFAAGDYERAAETLRKIIEANTTVAGAWSLYGRTQLQLRNIEGAKSAFLRALQLDSTDFAANLDLASAFHREGKDQDALPYVERALMLRPASPQARFEAAAVHAGIGKLEEARREFERLEREWPDFLEVHVELASLYARMTLKEESERERALVLSLSQKARVEGTRDVPR